MKEGGRDGEKRRMKGRKEEEGEQQKQKEKDGEEERIPRQAPRGRKGKGRKTIHLREGEKGMR